MVNPITEFKDENLHTCIYFKKNNDTQLKLNNKSNMNSFDMILKERRLPTFFLHKMSNETVKNSPRPQCNCNEGAHCIGRPADE